MVTTTMPRATITNNIKFLRSALSRLFGRYLAVSRTRLAPKRGSAKRSKSLADVASLPFNSVSVMRDMSERRCRRRVHQMIRGPVAIHCAVTSPMSNQSTKRPPATGVSEPLNSYVRSSRRQTEIRTLPDLWAWRSISTFSVTSLLGRLDLHRRPTNVTFPSSIFTLWEPSSTSDYVWLSVINPVSRTVADI